MSNNDPIAFFLTWVTYGTWLPGDDRTWVHHANGWQLPDFELRIDAQYRMRDDAVTLTHAQRKIVEQQIDETCQFRKWSLHAVNCRTNHVHTVVTAKETHPKKVRRDLKAWATRALRKLEPKREDWFAERGNIGWLYDEVSLGGAIEYTLHGQGSPKR